MEYLEDLLITADLQIKTIINDYIYLSLDTTNNLTYFKTSYFIPEVFMKDEISMKNIGMKWNETSFVKIPKDIHLLGKVWVTVNIPYFQIIEKLSNTTQITINNATINQMIDLQKKYYPEGDWDSISTKTQSASKTEAAKSAGKVSLGAPMYATNPTTGARIVSTDGGINWKPVGGK